MRSTMIMCSPVAVAAVGHKTSLDLRGVAVSLIAAIGVLYVKILLLTLHDHIAPVVAAAMTSRDVSAMNNMCLIPQMVGQNTEDLGHAVTGPLKARHVLIAVMELAAVGYLHGFGFLLCCLYLFFGNLDSGAACTPGIPHITNQIIKDITKLLFLGHLIVRTAIDDLICNCIGFLIGGIDRFRMRINIDCK